MAQGPARRATGATLIRRAGLLALALGLAGPGPPAGRADADLTLCRRWQTSQGEERIRLGNAIGAAAYLTKVRRLAESAAEAPTLLYAPSDLRRSCKGGR